MKISQRTFDFIVTEEVSSEAYYTRHYTRPEWPGGQSGVTVAIGYDLGYASRDKINEDWSGLVTADMLRAMQLCCGVRGTAARAILMTVKPLINIPWASAIAVFSNRDVPQWTAAVCKALPNTDKLSSTCLGVLVSLAYNRGCSFSLAGDRYAEMRAIKAHMVGQIPAIPGDIRSMKRLWPTVKGLRDRRDAEATLFQSGLTTAVEPEAKVAPTPAAPDPAHPLNAGPARTKPPATTSAQHTTAGAIVVGAVATSSALGYSTEITIGIGLLAVAVAGIVWGLWYHNRNP